MTPDDVDTRMTLVNAGNVKDNGTVLYHHDHFARTDLQGIINVTTINSIENTTCIRFLTHGAVPMGDMDMLKNAGFWRTLILALVKTVSNHMYQYIFKIIRMVHAECAYNISLFIISFI